MQRDASLTVVGCCYYAPGLVKVRGDNVGWFSGLEEGYGWNVMPQYKKKIGTLATELATYVPELKVIDSSCNMMCTCYPGAGARYTLHIDNARCCSCGRAMLIAKGECSVTGSVDG